MQHELLRYTKSYWWCKDCSGSEMCSVCMCVWVKCSVLSLCIKEADSLGEETLAQSGREGPNAWLTFAKWTEEEAFFHIVCDRISRADSDAVIEDALDIRKFWKFQKQAFNESKWFKKKKKTLRDVLVFNKLPHDIYKQIFCLMVPNNCLAK